MLYVDCILFLYVCACVSVGSKVSSSPCHACADPERYVRGGATLITFLVDEGIPL